MRQAAGVEDNRRQDEQDVRIEKQEQTEAKRPRLKLTYLYEMIEALREDHSKLSARVDELSKMLDSADHWAGPAEAAAAAAVQVEPAAEDREKSEEAHTGDGHGGGNVPDDAAEDRPDGQPLALQTAAAHRYVWWIEETTPQGRAMQFGAGALLRTPAEPADGIRMQAAAEAGEGRAPDEAPAEHAALWAGALHALGNAASTLTAGDASGGPAAGTHGDGGPRKPDAAEPLREWAAAELPSAIGGRLSAGDGGAPDEALLLELQEAARIADEIASHASRQPAIATAIADKPASTGEAADDAVPSIPMTVRSEAVAAADADTRRTDAPMPSRAASAMLVPRAERHQSKKRSLWSRLFTRQA